MVTRRNLVARNRFHLTASRHLPMIIWKASLGGGRQLGEIAHRQLVVNLLTGFPTE